MARRRHPRTKAKRLAEARVEILWKQARREVEADRPDLARVRMLSARRIAQRTRSKIPRHISRQVCKTCGTILIPGNTCRVRVRHNRSKHVVVTCLECGVIKRYYI